MATYYEFIKSHVGKGVDYDGCAGVQCVDLAKCYLREVFGIYPGAWGDAHSYYDEWLSYTTELQKNFDRIPNTPSFVPKKGDIVVWSGKMSAGGWGHIAIATGEGNTKYFYTYDQNWTGRHDPCTKIQHNYNYVLGVLRAKDQTKILGKTVVATPEKKQQSKYAKYKITTTTHFRHKPSFKDKSVGVLKLGRKVNIVRGFSCEAEGCIWSKVVLNKKEYYVPHKHVQKI